MKNFKRILAFVMVLCTVAAWMIPGVAAEETPASLTVNFGTVFSNAGVSNGTYLQSAAAALNGAYETNKWTIYCGTGTASIHGNDLYAGGRNRANYLELRNNNVSSYGTTVKRASQFIAPGTGEYVLSVSYGTASNADNKVIELGAYIMEMPETAYTKYTIPGPTAEGILTKASKTEPYGNGSVAGSGSGAGTFSAENTVSLVEGQEYMIIFYGIAADTTNAYAQFTGFALNPVVKYDYSVTYHANYEGADPATVADNENVTGSVATAKDITVDAVPFNRPATFLFEGWSTTPDGEVEYKADDVITLTSDAASIDLYAIWREVWDPANNFDWTVDFKTSFDNAGVAADGYLQSGNMTLLADAYATNGWKLYVDSTGTPSKSNSAYPARAAGNKKAFQMRSNSATEIGRVPLVFKAPGTGEYKLSLTFEVIASGAFRAPLAGAFILECPETPYTRYNIPFHTDASAQAVITMDPSASNQGDVFTSETSVTFEGGKEYILVFFIQQGTQTSYADFKDFSLIEVKPEATIGSNNYATLEEAVAVAVSGDTIKLGMDADVAELSLPAGVVLNLNGKTLIAEAFDGTIQDSKDGAGRVAVANGSATIKAAAGQVALWDNTTDFEGYRAYSYTFGNHEDGVYGSKAVSGVNTEIDFYDYERNFLATEFDEYGEVKQGKGDFKFYQTLDNGNTVLQQIKDDYAAGNTDWRFEYSNQQYQLGRGGVCFNWGGKSIRQFGAGYMAVRFEAPAEGKVTVSLKTHSTNNAANDAGFTLYILKASDVEALVEGDYEALHDTFVAAPATAVADLNTAIQTAYGNAEAVLSGISDSSVHTGAYEFEAGKEYIAVFLNNGSVSGALHMNFQNIKFTRAAVAENEVQSFWSVLQFTNTAAYTHVGTGLNADNLKIGFDMTWNGESKDFQFDNSIVEDWGNTQANDLAETYGFYVRVSGFSAFESGVLESNAYVIVNGNKVTADPIYYNYNIQ